MVYLSDWNRFEQAVTDLYSSAPHKARYTIKSRPKTGQLVLKVTDDITCIKYKTFSAIILNRFENLNLKLLMQIGNVKPKRQIIPTVDSTRAGTPLEDKDETMVGSTDTGVPAPPVGGAASKSKKKKKGKK